MNFIFSKDKAVKALHVLISIRGKRTHYADTFTYNRILKKLTSR